MSSLSWEYNRLTLVNLEDKPADFFKGLIQASSTAIVICDARQPDDPIAWVNPAFEAISGYTLAEVIGRNCRFLQGSDRDQPELAGLREALATGRSHTCTLRNYRKDGRQFWSRMHLFPVCDTAGAVTNFVAFLEDVSVAIQAQAGWRTRASASAPCWRAFPTAASRSTASGASPSSTARERPGCGAPPTNCWAR